MQGKAGPPRGTAGAAALGGVAALAAALALAAGDGAAEDPLRRGEYLVETAADCGICHTPRGSDGAERRDLKLAGGRVFAERGFRAVAPNITPDPETGIGRWSDAEIVAAIRDGRRPDGSIIGPPMPIELYRGLSDGDAAAIVAYLRTIPPVRHAVTERSRYPAPPEPAGPPVGHVPGPPEDDPVARGAYLAGPVAHCTVCHTPPDRRGRMDRSRIGAGGVPFEGPWGRVVSRNITADPRSGIGAWTDDQIIRALTQGVSADGRPLAPPMSARRERWAKLSARDLGDLLAYLRSLPPPSPAPPGGAP